jgi:hypothetical protein
LQLFFKDCKRYIIYFFYFTKVRKKNFENENYHRFIISLKEEAFWVFLISEFTQNAVDWIEANG